LPSTMNANMDHYVIMIWGNNVVDVAESVCFVITQSLLIGTWAEG